MFGGTTGGITLDDVEFALGRVFGRTVGKFPRKAATGTECTFADGFTGFTGSFAGTGGVEALFDDGAGGLRLCFKMVLQFFPDDLLHDAVDLAVGELGLGLSFEPGFGDFDGDDGDEAFADVVAGEDGILVL